MSGAKLFYIGVKALIRNEKDQILLLKADVSNHSKNTEAYWDIPGGRIEKGQNVEETLLREIKEETGIKQIVSSTFFTVVISKHAIPSENGTAGLALMIYNVEISQGSSVKLSDEHTEYEWVETAEAKTSLANKYPTSFTELL